MLAHEVDPRLALDQPALVTWFPARVEDRQVDRRRSPSNPVHQITFRTPNVRPSASTGRPSFTPAVLRDPLPARPIESTFR